MPRNFRVYYSLAYAGFSLFRERTGLGPDDISLRRGPCTRTEVLSHFSLGTCTSDLVRFTPTPRCDYGHYGSPRFLLPRDSSHSPPTRYFTYLYPPLGSDSGGLGAQTEDIPPVGTTPSPVRRHWDPSSPVDLNVLLGSPKVPSVSFGR